MNANTKNDKASTPETRDLTPATDYVQKCCDLFKAHWLHKFEPLEQDEWYGHFDENGKRTKWSPKPREAQWPTIEEQQAYWKREHDNDLRWEAIMEEREAVLDQQNDFYGDTEIDEPNFE